MTLVMKGRMFFSAIFTVEVPRHREARLYSRSRMMITWVRIKAAILSQPMTVKANTMVQKLAVNTSTITEINRI